MQPNGNVYFSLKDREAVLNCVAFGERAAAFPAFDNGADVIAYGEVKIYARAGSNYQLVATRLELTGVGALHAKYEELSAKLQREGLFATERKKPAPRFPFRVALVGSPSGDGTRDFITQARAARAPRRAAAVRDGRQRRRCGAGDRARDSRGRRVRAADLVVVVRGGGSFEDLFGFSDERVVRAIAACKTPTVAAIGHERDVPLIELVADVRASTPSTAAQTVLPKREDLLRTVAERASARRASGTLTRPAERIETRSPNRPTCLRAKRSTAAHAPSGAIARSRALLLPLERRLVASSPRALFERRRAAVAQLRERRSNASRGDIIEARRRRLAPLAAGLRPALGRVVARDDGRSGDAQSAL